MADRKVYEAIFQLGAKVQASLGKGFGAVQQNMKAVQQQAKRTEQATKAFSGALKWAGGIAAGYFSMNAIANYMKQSADAALAENVSQRKLAIVMRQRMEATDGQIQSIDRLIQAQERLGVVDGAAQKAGAQELATYLNKVNSIKTLLPAMNNLLVQQYGLNASQEQAAQMATMLGKVMDGQVGGMRRIGWSFTDAQERVLKYGSEQARAAMLAKIVTENIGNMNEEMGLTDEGKLQRARNALGSIQMEIGKKVIPMQAKMAEMQLKFLPHVEKVLPLLDKIPPLIEKGAEAVEFVIENWDKIAPVVKTATAAIITCKAATIGLVVAQKAGMVINTLSSAYTTAAAAISYLKDGLTAAQVAQMIYKKSTIQAFIAQKALTVYQKAAAAAQWLFNASLFGCPIIWIVGGVAALAAGAYLLIKNWDKVKAFFVGLWEKIQPIFAAMSGFFSKIFGGGKKVVEVDVKSSSSGPRSSPIPQLARGASNFKGGLAMTGERGRELLNLPRGTQVTPNNRTEELLNGLSGRGGGISLTMQQNFYGPVDKETVIEANRESFEEFKRKLAEARRQNRRLSFG